MASQANADVLALQLEKVRSKLPIMYERDNVFFAKVEKKGDKVSTRNMRVPLQLRPGGRPGLYNPAGGAMGLGGGTKYDVAQLTPVHLKFGIQIDKLVELATDSTEKAIEDAVKKEMANAMPQFRSFIDKLSQQSNTGQLGSISSFASTVWTLAASNFKASQRFIVGMGLVVVDTTLNTTRAGTPIVLSVDDVNGKITVDANPTGIANTDVILPEGSTASGGSITSTALFGVPYHQNDAQSGTWLQLARASYPEVWTPSVNAASGLLAWSFIRQALTKIRTALGAEAATGLQAYMHFFQGHAYEDLLQAVINIDKGANGNSAVDLGFKEVETIGGVPTLFSYNADPTRIDFINFAAWGRAVIQDLTFFTPPGSDQKIFTPVDSTTGSPTAASLMYLTTGFQYFTDNPRKGSYIKSLAIPAGY
jgi:hypothetical protein